MAHYGKMNPSLILDKAFNAALIKVDEQYRTLLEWGKLDLFIKKEEPSFQPMCREELDEFLILKGVKIAQGGKVIWNHEFIKEYFGKLAKTYVIHLAKEILAYKSEFEHFQERLSSGEFIAFLDKELKKSDLVLSSYEGRIYVKAKRSRNELEHFEQLLRFSNNEDISLNLLAIDSPYRPALDMGYFSQVKLLSDMWLKIECAIVMDEVIRSLLKSIKKPVDIVKCPFKIESQIFVDDGQDYLFHILLKSGVITYHNQNKKVETHTGFRGACAVLFKKLQDEKKLINPSANFADFIDYLNDSKGYNALIPTGNKSTIATETTRHNGWRKVKVEYSKIFGE
ncbi:hypothetical protein [[Muricauda] lutisoli]|uniref:DUF3644 domain-containing protein n=1 Tax=[Muricauda] lutisoli TaxID=2816035 RepID=A0ABS3EV22_9FLAO|nr:hypothetical protein [[Muricauda] lutisoli]MBO0330093.1 hypothetical protein [[Muricauda] lutisoli]